MSNEKTVVPELTSEKLTVIESEILANAAAIKQAFVDGLDESEIDQLLVVKFKLGNDKKREIAAIQSANIEAAKIAARNAKIAEFDELINAAVNFGTVSADKKASDADKTAASDKLAGLREKFVNVVAGAVAAPKVAKTSDNGSDSGKTSAKKAEIVSMYAANLASGMNHTDAMAAVVATGVPRGSAWAPIDQYRKENGLK